MLITRFPYYMIFVPFSGNMMGVACRAGTAYPSITHELTRLPYFGGVRVNRYWVVCVMLCRSCFVLFLLAIVLSVLWFTASDYPFGIFKLFSCQTLTTVTSRPYKLCKIGCNLWEKKTYFFPIFSICEIDHLSRLYTTRK